MKIYYRSGVVKAQAESMEDIRTLLALGTVITKEKEIEIPSKKKGFNAWKNKPYLACEICTQEYKNILLHKKRSHAELVQRIESTRQI